MRRPTPAIRRLCLVIDMEGYSRHKNMAQLDAQNRILTIVRSVCRRARIKLSHMVRQDKGDGVMLLLPVGVDEARVVAALVLGLRNALHEANRNPEQWGTLRLRAALTQGVVHTGDLGYVGQAVVEACRLVDVPELKDGLARAKATSDLAFIVADDLFRDVVEQDYPGLPSSEFHPFNVALKEYTGTAWITLAPKGPAVDPYASAHTTRLIGGIFVGVVAVESAAIIADGLWDLLADDDTGATTAPPPSIPAGEANRDHETGDDDDEDHPDDDPEEHEEVVDDEDHPDVDHYVHY
ncbi:hypothetical protein [Actinoplanes sp. HUAS TT8]|uniref:hypothetical protein n=1 Tax=Actinoplanes sp. HUAS TT8 TaxID=3447453 RepID=UPI003F524482